MPIPHSAARRRIELALETARTLIRKTSLQDRTDDPLRSGKRADKTSRFSLSRYALSRGLVSRARNGNVGVRIVAARLPKALLPKTVAPSRYSERSSLHDVRYHASDACPARQARKSIMQPIRICVSLGRDFSGVAFSPGNLRGAKAGLPTEAAQAAKVGGARRDRTDDLLLAKQALSQLSYGPSSGQVSVVSNQRLTRF